MIDRNLFLLFCLFLTPFLTHSQGEANNWYFGFGAGLTFQSDGSAISVEDSAMYSNEGCATISNELGELQFYSDGTTVYDRNHQIMINGEGLYGDQSSTQSVIIVPMPGSYDLFILFTVGATEENIRGRGLNYSIIDMSMSNGNGAVIEKNVNLLNDCSEKLTAVVKECDTDTIWVLTFATETGLLVSRPIFNTFHAFEINSFGVSNTSVKSTFNNLNVIDDRGYLKISPNGLKMASANASSGLYLYDFDNQTGMVSNQQELTINSLNNNTYGVEFSPNSQYLYATASNNLYSYNGQESALLQFDLSDTDLNASQVILDDRAIFRSALQLGPNGKIYRPITFNYITGTRYLGVINNPNEKGLGSNYVHNQVELISGNSSQGLPPFVVSNFTEVSINNIENTFESSTICEGNSVLLETQLIAGATYTWEKDNIPFDNPNLNRFIVPTSQLSDSGTYRVTIIRPGYTECPITGETVVNVVPLPDGPDLNGDFCDMYDENAFDGIMEVNLNEFSVDPNLNYLYYESEEDLAVNNFITIPENYINSNPFEHQLWYKVTNENGCESNGELILRVISVPELNLQETFYFCENDEAPQIFAPAGFDDYRWYVVENEEETLIASGNSFSPSMEGNYILEGLMNYNNNGNESYCSKRTTFNIEYLESAEILEIIINDGGSNNKIEIIANGNGEYEYAVDGVNFQENNRFDNLPSGILTVYVNEKSGCGETITEIEIDAPLSPEQFPKFFTPNGDGVNDNWNFVPNDVNNDIDISVIHIYNRYGKFLYQFSPLDQGWDGTVNGKLQPEDDYWYEALSFEKGPFRGHFSLKY